MQQQFNKWTLDSIREEGASLQWLENIRFEFSATTAQAIQNILESKTIVLITDRDRMWFAEYIMNSLNKLSQERPLIPIVIIDDIYHNYDLILGGEMVDMLEDMLSISYKEDYFFWYIGRGDDRRADIAKRSSESYMWLMDENYQNSIPLHSYDKNIDIQLIQLYQQFNKSLNAVLFGDVVLDD